MFDVVSRSDVFAVVKMMLSRVCGLVEATRGDVMSGEPPGGRVGVEFAKMHILVINPGSSSIKLSIFSAGGERGPRSVADGELSGIGGDEASFRFRGADGRDLNGGAPVQAGSMHEALTTVERAIDAAGLPAADAVGYRVVHPGPKLRGHQRVTPEVMAALKEAVRFAPLHDPVAVELIEEMMRRMPEVPHVACFDTVFHETIPEMNRTFALPKQVRDEGVRRYGFHGLSCESVMQELRESGLAEGSYAIAHLGSGCSVSALVNGASVYTTMGLTPTGGVVMGTRPGDLDPGVLMYLLRRDGATVESVDEMVNRASGLKGLGGVNDMRELRRRAARGDAEARLGIGVFVASVARAIAGEMVVNGAEAVVFTGGIGEHDAETRDEACRALRRLGVELDAKANEAGLSGRALGKISTESSGIAVYVAKADEDRMVAQHVMKMCFRSQ